ncbi:MAG: chromosomal replication initiator protein DnaA [Christensenellales bacterium]
MDNITAKWEEVLIELANQVSAISYDMWLKKLEPIDVIEGVFYIKAPNNMTKKICNESYSFLISQAISKVLNIDEFEIFGTEEYEEFTKHNIKQNEKEEKKECPFNPKFTFENFVVGKSNQFVYSAAKSVAENPGARFNPLFIYGGVGLGKTHLLHSIGNFIFKNNPKLNILYVTCEKFTNDYLECLHNKNKDISKFREKYRSLDVLMVDDIQFISNKESTQLEFFNTFNDLHQSNKHIIITSDRPPNEISTLNDRMVSRFNMGLIQDIQAPDFETRYVILQKKAQLENCLVDNDALVFIAENVTSNIRELEGVLSKTAFLASLRGHPRATIEEAKEALKTKLEESKEQLTPNLIIDIVSKYYRIDKQAILGTKRTKEIADARHMSIYLMCELMNLPMATIGREIFSRDHTTIMHARNKIADAYGKNDKITREINDLKSMILQQ